jgi:hypothetical protein
MNDPYEIAKNFSTLIHLVATDKKAFTEAAEAVIEMSVENMDRNDLIEFYYEMKMQEFRDNPENLQAEMEYFTETFDEMQSAHDNSEELEALRDRLFQVADEYDLDSTKVSHITKWE